MALTAEQLEAQIRADPNTAEIAATSGMSLDEYVALVLQYALNPQLEPELYIVADEHLKAAGLEVPDPEAMRRYVTSTVSAMTAATRTSFEEKPRELPQPPPAVAEPSTVDQAEAERIAQELRRRGGKL